MLRDKKSPRVDNITSGLIKHGGLLLVKALTVTGQKLLEDKAVVEGVG